MGGAFSYVSELGFVSGTLSHFFYSTCSSDRLATVSGMGLGVGGIGLHHRKYLHN